MLSFTLFILGRRHMKKKIVVPFIAAGGFAFVLAWYFVLSPFFALHGIKSAIENQDATALSQHIDFDLLRENIKVQLQDKIDQEMNFQSNNNLFATFATAIANKLIDGVVEVFISPSSIAIFMAGRSLDTKGGFASLVDREETSQAAEDLSLKQWLKGARVAFHSMDEFSIWVKNDQGSETGFVMERQGLSWRLTNIQLPQ